MWLLTLWLSATVALLVGVWFGMLLASQSESQSIQLSLRHGYREGYVDGVTGQPARFEGDGIIHHEQ